VTRLENIVRRARIDEQRRLTVDAGFGYSTHLYCTIHSRIKRYSFKKMHQVVAWCRDFIWKKSTGICRDRLRIEQVDESLN